MVHTRQAKPQPFKTSALTVLTLDDSHDVTVTHHNDNSNNNNTAVVVPVSSPSQPSQSTTSASGQPKSWKGFDVKTDMSIRRQAKKSWYDLNDEENSQTTTPFMTSSPFEGISGKAPTFPVPEQEAKVAEAAAEENAAAVAPSPATPTRTFEQTIEAAKSVEEAPLKPGEEDSDGAQAFEEEIAPKEETTTETLPQLPTYENNAPQYLQYQQYTQQLPAYNGGSYYNQPYNSAPPAYPPRSMAPASGAFHSHFRDEQARRQQQSMPPQTTTPPPQENSSSDAPLQAKPANHELTGFLPFYKFEDAALNGELPSAEAVGHSPTDKFPKLFFGHVWSRVPTGVVQWLVESFGPSGSVAFDPQLHYNKEGWFRGCLHVSVDTPDAQALIYALHKRVLFDHEGVWFAETADQMRILDDYCRRLRALPQQIRHTKLQSLPCNPLACEMARNE